MTLKRDTEINFILYTFGKSMAKQHFWKKYGKTTLLEKVWQNFTVIYL